MESRWQVKFVQLSAAEGIDARLASLLRELEAIAGEVPIESLPSFFGGLERARWVAQLRISTAPLSGRTAEPLLTVEQLCARFGVSKAQVYRLAKTHLRSAVVEVGEGTLRFDPDRLERFIEARRRC